MLLRPRVIRLRPGCRWVLTIECPSRWVVENVLPNIIKRFFVTDNVVVVAALPDIVRIRVFTEPFGYTDFETTDNRTN